MRSIHGAAGDMADDDTDEYRPHSRFPCFPVFARGLPSPTAHGGPQIRPKAEARGEARPGPGPGGTPPSDHLQVAEKKKKSGGVKMISPSLPIPPHPKQAEL